MTSLPNSASGLQALFAAVDAARASAAAASRADCSSSGVLVCSASGGGKTWFLRALERSSPPAECVFVSCSTLLEEFRGDLEQTLGDVFRKTASAAAALLPAAGRVLLLLDDLDCLFLHNNDDGIQGASLTSSALLSLVDDFVVPGGGVLVATCTRIDALPQGLTLSRRLGEPLILPHPSAGARKDIFLALLSDPRLRITPRNHVNLDDLCLELSLRTQGCSAGDALQLVRNCTHESLLRQCHESGVGDIVEISAADLLNESLNVEPSGAQFSNLLSKPVTTPPNQLIGLEVQQQRLRRAILGSLEGGNVRRPLGRMCRGVVIHGPSGTGKSSLAAWVAHEAKNRFRLLVVPCADLVHKVVGESERRISDCFKAARSMAPCLLLLDNLEFVLGGAQDDAPQQEVGGSSGRRQRSSHVALDRLLSSLLVEIDGLGDPAGAVLLGAAPPPVVVIATTTDVHCLDKALTRPGRLEEHIALGLPDRDQRYRLLLHLLEKFDATRFEGPPGPDDLRHIANQVSGQTAGKSYAELANLVQTAAQASLTQYLSQHPTQGRLPSLQHLLLSQYQS